MPYAAIYVPVQSPQQEAAAHAVLLDCAQAFSPRVEDTAADTVVLGIAGLERLFGPPARLAQDLARRALELGLAANIAVAANPDAAVLAARGFTGVTVIPPGKQAERLGSLPVDVLQVAPEMLETLDRWGVRDLRHLAALPEVALVERLGQEGLRLQKLARGALERSLVQAAPPLKFEETMELEYPVALLEPLAFVLGRLLEHLCALLGARALATNELRLVLGLDLADCSEEVSSSSFLVSRENQASAEQRETRNEKRYCLRLPLPMLDSRLFLKLLQLELRRHPPEAPVVRVTLAAEPVKPRPGQGGLFLPATPAPDRLELTLARLAGIVGAHKIGAAEILDTHRPDAFQMKRFVPAAPRGLKPLARAAAVSARLKPCPPAVALRRFRPPLAAAVEVRAGEPVRIAASEIQGEAASVSGPWRNSGDWWKGKASRIDTDAHGSNWARDEWDIAVPGNQGIALYRIYREIQSGAWFVDGTYD
ncbi:MAG TPA: DNA polymerase Y family protein [Terriglobales bacterium]|jgi:protein ImuB|nr:DNA polymerase Y family protein [Terriglobales bacterium]